MNIKFCGAAKEVTGSNFLVEAAGKRFLIDCGLIQGRVVDEERNYSPFYFNPKEIDFLILTHAHIDHSGRIPKLYNEGFTGPTYCTKATKELCEIMLEDSGFIQEGEAEWKNRKRIREGKSLLKPLYTAKEGKECNKYFEAVEYMDFYEVDENIRFRLNDAGHMLGSAIIEMWITENGKTTKIVFSGDIGNNNIPILQSPTPISSADYLVMESTYGDRLHLSLDGEQKAKYFLDTITKTLKRGGTVIIPSFAVGRAQEILYELDTIKDKTSDENLKEQYRELMKATVYVDSPLAISATAVYKNNTELFDEEAQKRILRGDDPLEFDGLEFTKSSDESKALNEVTSPSIIISASGMCDAGRIKHHLKHRAWNPLNTILFIGYQAQNTLGRRIVEGEKRVKIFGEEVIINAEVEFIDGYSGHADQEMLLNFIKSFETKPKKIFLVHGEPGAQEVFKSKIEEMFGIEVIIPSRGDEYSIKGLTEKIDERKNHKNTLSRERKIRFANKITDFNDEISILSNDVKDKVLTRDSRELLNSSEEEILYSLYIKIKKFQEELSKIVDVKKYENENEKETKNEKINENEKEQEQKKINVDVNANVKEKENIVKEIDKVEKKIEDKKAVVKKEEKSIEDDGLEELIEIIKESKKISKKEK
ncbi:MAG: MBL fold metallo-hydrolase RNA specificity domain-containing protein [Clostridium sp.]